MKISFDRIARYLADSGVSFEATQPADGEFTIASLYAPVDRGFYYMTDKWSGATISDSLMLVGTGFDPRGVEGEGNCLIRVKGDPQLLFYRLVRDLVGAKRVATIAGTALIDSRARIGQGVRIEDYCIVGACEIGEGVTIASHCRIDDGATIGDGAVIESHSIIGARGVAWVWDEERSERVVLPQLGGVSIGARCLLGANSIVVRGSLNERTVIGDDSLLAPGCRLGHGTVVGRSVHLANNVVTGGNTRIGDHSFIGSAAVFRPKVSVHPHTIVGAGAVVVRDTSGPGLTLMGVPAIERETKSAPSGMPKPRSFRSEV